MTSVYHCASDDYLREDDHVNRFTMNEWIEETGAEVKVMENEMQSPCSFPEWIRWNGKKAHPDRCMKKRLGPYSSCQWVPLKSTSVWFLSGRTCENIQKDFNDYPSYLFLNFNRENCRLTTTHRPLLYHTDKTPSSWEERCNQKQKVWSNLNNKFIQSFCVPFPTKTHETSTVWGTDSG